MAEYSNGYGIPYNPGGHQDILNQSWPPADVARSMHDRPDAIAVRVRVVWERDGEEWSTALRPAGTVSMCASDGRHAGAGTCEGRQGEGASSVGRDANCVGG